MYANLEIVSGAICYLLLAHLLQQPLPLYFHAFFFSKNVLLACIVHATAVHLRGHVCHFDYFFLSHDHWQMPESTSGRYAAFSPRILEIDCAKLKLKLNGNNEV